MSEPIQDFEKALIYLYVLAHRNSCESLLRPQHHYCARSS